MRVLERTRKLAFARQNRCALFGVPVERYPEYFGFAVRIGGQVDEQRRRRPVVRVFVREIIIELSAHRIPQNRFSTCDAPQYSAARIVAVEYSRARLEIAELVVRTGKMWHLIARFDAAGVDPDHRNVNKVQIRDLYRHRNVEFGWIKLAPEFKMRGVGPIPSEAPLLQSFGDFLPGLGLIHPLFDLPTSGAGVWTIGAAATVAAAVVLTLTKSARLGTRTPKIVCMCFTATSGM